MDIRKIRLKYVTIVTFYLTSFSKIDKLFSKFSMYERRKKMIRKINHEAIARKVGLERSTVTKILNGDPKFENHVPEETRVRVIKTAEKMGYFLYRTHRTNRRLYERNVTNKPTEIELKKKGKVVNSGKARVRNISKSGALIDRIRLRKEYLPQLPFICAFTFGGLRPITGKVVRIQVDSPMALVLKLEKLLSVQGRSSIGKRGGKYENN